jgi:hypothetical protein
MVKFCVETLPALVAAGTDLVIHPNTAPEQRPSAGMSYHKDGDRPAEKLAVAMVEHGLKGLSAPPRLGFGR